MTQKYDVVLNAPLGQRFGTLVLETAGGDVKSSFFLLGFENPVRGRCTGQTLDLKHTLRTLLSTLDCETHAELRGDALFGVVRSRHSCMELRGKKQEDGQKT